MSEDRKNCVACGHGVVEWDPYESRGEDDVFCFACGLHANSEAVKRIKELEAAIRKHRGDMWGGEHTSVQHPDDVTLYAVLGETT